MRRGGRGRASSTRKTTVRLGAWRGRGAALVAAGGFALATLLFIGTGCGGARPYRAMAKAASSEENAPAQVEDMQLKARLRETLLATDADAALHVTPYVYMGHAFLVGFVNSPAQAQTLSAAVQNVAGVRSLDTYLPDRPADTEMASDLSIKAEVKAALAIGGDRPTQIDLDVLAGHVVLLGVVADQSAVDSAVAAARGVSGVTGVTSFLLLPEPEYQKPLRLLR